MNDFWDNLRIVLELAEAAAVDKEEATENGELELYEEQQAALNAVNLFLEGSDVDRIRLATGLNLRTVRQTQKAIVIAASIAAYSAVVVGMSAFISEPTGTYVAFAAKQAAVLAFVMVCLFATELRRRV
jgi:hypothetical protein